MEEIKSISTKIHRKWNGYSELNMNYSDLVKFKNNLERVDGIKFILYTCRSYSMAYAYSLLLLFPFLWKDFECIHLQKMLSQGADDPTYIIRLCRFIGKAFKINAFEMYLSMEEFKDDKIRSMLHERFQANHLFQMASIEETKFLTKLPLGDGFLHKTRDKLINCGASPLV